MLSARRNSNESGFVKKISREGGGAQKFHHDFLSHLKPCSMMHVLQGAGAHAKPRPSRAAALAIALGRRRRLSSPAAAAL